VGECFFCDPDPDGVGAAAVAAEHEFGMLLFEAEEMLSRGHGDKALVIASRAVKARPDNLTALAIYERARRDILRGKRREKLEARIAEGRAHFAAGRFAEAERIVTSALKLLPEHLLAQQLHAMLKERRLAANTVEAEAERELDRLSHARARRAVQTARAALASGWHRKALVAARRGLRMCPDDPELLTILKEIQRSDDGIERDTARRRAVLRRVRVALDLLAHDRMDECLKILRAILRAEPDDTRAQAAVQEARRVWLQRHAPPISAPSPAPPRPAAPPAAPRAAAPPPRGPIEPPTPRPPSPPRPLSPPPPAPEPAVDPEVLRRLSTVRSSGSSGRTIPGLHVQRPDSIPGEILLPRTRRRATPILLVLGAAVAVLVIGYFTVARAPRLAATPAPPVAAAALPTPSPRDRAPGPLDAVVPELRDAIESALAQYARAMETRDPALLARVRPDLSDAQRALRLQPFAGAINVAIDLRVLDIVQEGAAAVAVSVLRTDVIVGGTSSQAAPVEEVLRFQHGAGGWVLDATRR
jgi:tetratricopeptide (TPR) repeat protein